MTTTQVPFQGKDVLVKLFVPQVELFNGNGTAVNFTVSKTPIADFDRDGTVDASDVTVKVGGVVVAVTSVDANTGVVTLTVAPASGTGNVEITYSYEHEPIMATEFTATETVENIQLDQLGSDERLIAETSIGVEGSLTLRKEDADMVKLFWGGTQFGAARTKFIIQVTQTRGASITKYFYHEAKFFSRDETQTAGDLAEEVYNFTAAGGKLTESN